MASAEVVSAPNPLQPRPGRGGATRAPGRLHFADCPGRRAQPAAGRTARDPGADHDGGSPGRGADGAPDAGEPAYNRNAGAGAAEGGGWGRGAIANIRRP